MKDLGHKQKDLYDSPISPQEHKNKVIYPEISFPLDLVEGMELEVNDEVEIKIKGRVCGLENTKYSKRVSFDAKEGEVTKTGKEKTSLLEEA